VSVGKVGPVKRVKVAEQALPPVHQQPALPIKQAVTRGIVGNCVQRPQAFRGLRDKPSHSQRTPKSFRRHFSASRLPDWGRRQTQSRRLTTAPSPSKKRSRLYAFGSSPADGMTTPEFGSIQAMWSWTATQPGVFSAMTLRPSRSRSLVIAPLKVATPF
jgi:hypothetical protein